MKIEKEYEFNYNDIEEISDRYKDLIGSTIIENWVEMVARLFRGLMDNGFTREEAFELMKQFSISGKKIIS